MQAGAARNDSMALATRCPNCQAMFRVVADQLRLRGGLVRCGTCRHVFDAIGSLAYVDDATVKSAPVEPREPHARGRKPAGDPEAAASPSPRAGAPTTKSTPPPRPREATRPITLRITPDAGYFAQRADRDAERHDDDRGRRARAADAGVPTLLVTEDQNIGSTDQTATTTTPAEPVPGEAASGLEAASGVSSSNRSASSKRRRQAITTPAQPSTDRAAAAPSAGVDTQAPANGAVEAAPLFLRDPERRRGFSILYGTGAVALVVVIAIQLAVLFRTELVTRWPALRPTLVEICSAVGCSVGWPTRSELLAVVGTELQAVPGTDVLELTAVIRNRANFKVAMPAIEVTLTDTQNRALARKVFAPVDYLASTGEPSSRIDEGLGAGSDYTVRIVFEARGLAAAGFVVYPFYL